MRQGIASVGALAAGCIGLGVLVFALPYASYLHSNTGSWELTAKTNDASMESWQAVADHDRRARDEVIYELADDGVSFAAGRASLAELAKDDPSGYGHIVATNVRQLIDEVAWTVEREHIGWGWALLPLPVSVLAVWGAWRLRRRPSVWLLLTALLLPTATAVAFFVQVRYLIPATAFVCILAGLAFAELAAWRLGSRWAWAWCSSCGPCSRPPMAATASSTGASPWSTGSWGSGSPRTRRRRAHHDAQHGHGVLRRPTRRRDPLRHARTRCCDFAEHHGVDYIVADSYTFDELRPQLVEWIEGPRRRATRWRTSASGLAATWWCCSG